MLVAAAAAAAAIAIFIVVVTERYILSTILFVFRIFGLSYGIYKPIKLHLESYFNLVPS